MRQGPRFEVSGRCPPSGLNSTRQRTPSNSTAASVGLRACTVARSHRRSTRRSVTVLAPCTAPEAPRVEIRSEPRSALHDGLRSAALQRISFGRAPPLELPPCGFRDGAAVLDADVERRQERSLPQGIALQQAGEDRRFVHGENPTPDGSGVNEIEAVRPDAAQANPRRLELDVVGRRLSKARGAIGRLGGLPAEGADADGEDVELRPPAPPHRSAAAEALPGGTAARCCGRVEAWAVRHGGSDEAVHLSRRLTPLPSWAGNRPRANQLRGAQHCARSLTR